MAITEAAVAPAAVARVRARVLVVDDHSLLRTGVANIINQELDLEVVAEAADGRDGVEAFRAYRPDVTLMDLRMPEMEGDELAGQVRAVEPDVKVLYLTSHVDSQFEAKPQLCPEEAHLDKPFTREGLREAVALLLFGRRRF